MKTLDNFKKKINLMVGADRGNILTLMSHILKPTKTLISKIKNRSSFS